MGREMDCEEVVALAPELALDVADGLERDASLRHLGGCASCRHLVSELSSMADDLLLLAPEHEPPAGLESRVLDAIELAEGPAPAQPASLAAARRSRANPRSWARPLAVAASFVLAIAVGAGAMFAATAGDRRVAGDYRALLGVGHGSFFAAASLRDGTREVGTAWGYAGDPSWVFVSMRSSIGEPRSFRAWLLTSGGRRVSLGRAELGRGWSSWGRNLPVDLSTVRELWLEPVDGGPGLVATFHPDDPWSG
jgi:hypothetical protein